MADLPSFWLQAGLFLSRSPLEQINIEHVCLFCMDFCKNPRCEVLADEDNQPSRKHFNVKML